MCKMMAKVITSADTIISPRRNANQRGEVELVILKYCDTTNIQKYLKKGNVKGKNKGIKIQNIKHKRNEKREEEMQKEK